MTDSSHNINIGQYAKGVIGQYISGNTIIQEQKLLITPEAIELNPFQARSPYKALKRFDVDDREYFFGRYQFVLELQAAIQDSNLILVLGASGSGKSSVVRARLIPEFLGTSSNRHDFILTPKEDPFQSLYESLLGRDKVGQDKDYCFSESKVQFVLEGKSNGKPDVFTQAVRQLKDKESEWLIFIDQFEELFTRCTSLEQRKNFIKSIAQIAEAEDRSVKIVLAMRADFVEQFSPYPQFGQIVQRQIHLVTDMPEDELELAIKGPAAKHGVRFEPGLAKEIIQDVQGQAGALPLMQYTLDQLWKYEVKIDGLTDHVLNTKNYRDLGKVRGSLEKHVNEIYEELGVAGQQTAKRIFLSLVKLITTDGVVKPVSQSISRSALQGEAIQETIDRLINENLLVSNSKGLSQSTLQMQTGKSLSQQATIEISHEILLSSWKILDSWIKEAKEILLIKSRLVEDMGRWNNRKQANEELLKGSVLEKVLELKKENLFELQSVPLSAEEAKYIDASQRYKRRELKRSRRVALGALIGFVLMAGVAIFSAIQARQAEIGQIQASVALSTAKLANNQGLEADIESIRAGKILEQSIFQKIFPDSQLRMSVLGQLQQTVNTERERNRLEIYQGRIASVAVSPNGKQIATIGYDGIGRLWDAYGRQLTKIKSDQGIINSIVFSPDGNKLATSGDNGNINLWSASGNQLAEIKDYQGQVESVVFSPNGRQLAITRVMPSLSGIQMFNSNVILWDTSGNRLAELEGLQDNVSDVVFSPDGKQIATVGSEDTASLWDTSGKKLAEFKGHQRLVTSVSFSPNGKQLATSGHDDTIRLWEISGKQLRKITAHQGRIRRVIFSPDGKQLATMSILSNSHENMVSLWNTSGEQLNSIKVQERVRSIVFSPDGKQLATSGDDGIARLWNGADNHLVELKVHQGRLDIAVFSPDGRQLVTNGDDGTVRLWDTFDNNLAEFKGSKGNLPRPLFSPDGKQLVTIGEDDKVRLWETSGKQVAELKSSPERTNSVVFSPDGKYIVTSGDYGRVRLWDTSGKQLVEFKGHQGFFSSVVFSPDGKQLATSGNDDAINLWDIFGSQNGAIKTHQEITNLAFSPSGKYLATSGSDSFVRIWNTSGKQVFAIKVNQKNITNMLFSPDGQYLAISGEGYNAHSTLNRTIAITLWNIFSNQIIEIENQQKNFINGVVFSPNSKNLATSGDDGLTRLWDTSGKQLAEFKGHQGPITSVVFSPDGKQLATTGNESIVRLWDTSGKQLSTIETYQWSVASAVFSPDGKQLATSSNNDTRLWQVGGIDDLLARNCNRVRNFLKNKVAENDRNLCDGIGREG
jgi:WD40 repeat protein